jgi:hypothetical protein
MHTGNITRIVGINKLRHYTASIPHRFIQFFDQLPAGRFSALIGFCDSVLHDIPFPPIGFPSDRFFDGLFEKNSMILREKRLGDERLELASYQVNH